MTSCFFFQSLGIFGFFLVFTVLPDKYNDEELGRGRASCMEMALISNLVGIGIILALCSLGKD